MKNQQIILPKKKKINDVEEVVVPIIKCDICGIPITQGLHQIRLKLIRKAFMKKTINGWIRVSPVMKREDVYMCNDCIKAKKKWRGTNPIYPK